MNLTTQLLLALLAAKDWITLTKVRVRVSPRLGSYVLDIDGSIGETIKALSEEGSLAGIEEIQGILRSIPGGIPYAFRLDSHGPQIAANTPEETVKVIQPQLQAVLATSEQ